MKLVLLNKEQLAYIYSSRMIYDFPPMELKPLDRMYEAYDCGNYVCYAMVDDACDEVDVLKHVLGYALYVKTGEHYLFDYFAINSDRRNEGLGSKFLALLTDQFKDSASVILEVEDPDYSDNEEESTLQVRRFNFYLRNGYVNTGIKVEMFDVDYIVLELDLGKNHDSKTVADLYLAHYKAMLPDELFKQKVKVKEL